MAQPPPKITTEEGVVNLALDHLGQPNINSFSDDSDAGQLARTGYALHRDVLIRAFTWNCFVWRAELSVDFTPVYEFGNGYNVPSDWYRTLHVQGQDQTPWHMEGRSIVTDLSSPIKIKYLRWRDVSYWDPMFKSCLAAKLAMYWAEPLVKSSTTQESMTRLFVEELKQAISTDSIEKTGTIIIADDWLLARATGNDPKWAKGTSGPF